MNNKDILSKLPFFIFPEPGRWTARLSAPNGDTFVTFDNKTVPETSSMKFIAKWAGRSINWALCDWSMTFGFPYVGIPTHEEIINYLQGPDWIPASN